MFNGHLLNGAKDPLLVKFADGGSKKKNSFKSPDPNARAWRDVTEVPIKKTKKPNLFYQKTLYFISCRFFKEFQLPMIQHFHKMVLV